MSQELHPGFGMTKTKTRSRACRVLLVLMVGTGGVLVAPDSARAQTESPPHPLRIVDVGLRPLFSFPDALGLSVEVHPLGGRLALEGGIGVALTVSGIATATVKYRFPVYVGDAFEFSIGPGVGSHWLCRSMRSSYRRSPRPRRFGGETVWAFASASISGPPIRFATILAMATSACRPCSTEASVSRFAPTPVARQRQPKCRARRQHACQRPLRRGRRSSLCPRRARSVVESRSRPRPGMSRSHACWTG